jgi:hypothetical protein
MSLWNELKPTRHLYPCRGKNTATDPLPQQVRILILYDARSQIFVQSLLYTLHSNNNGTEGRILSFPTTCSTREFVGTQIEPQTQKLTGLGYGRARVTNNYISMFPLKLSALGPISPIPELNVEQIIGSKQILGYIFDALVERCLAGYL